MEDLRQRRGLMERLYAAQPKQLWRGYLVALGLIVSLLLGSHVAHIMTMKRGADDTAVINLSGRQRMLSQRILFLASELTTVNGQYAAKLLEDAIQQFENAHEALLPHVAQSDVIADHYAVNQDDGLDRATQDFIALSRLVLSEGGQNTDSVVLLKELGAFRVLRDLEIAVDLFEAQADGRAYNLHLIQEITLFLAVLIVLAEGWLIFWPAQVIINRAIARLDRRNEEMQATNQELAELADQMTHAALHDTLTGIPNRHRLEQELEARLASETDDVLCLMHIDLDRFKEVNDTLGHQIGDQVLQHCAKIMALTIRDDDLVARVGGDEFIVLLELPRNHASQKATDIAESLIRRISEPFDIERKQISIGASIGIAFHADAESAMKLIGNADIALYQAKNDGRGVSRFFNNEMRQEIEHRHTLLQDLKAAVDGEEFEPFLQPQVHFSDGKLIGFESLARWRHPEQGILSPASFIDLSRELGLIHQIDRQILRKSLRALVKLRNDGWDVPTVSVNFDACTLRQPNLLDWLQTSIEDAGVSPNDLIVEVTESVLIEGESDPAVKTLRQFRELGVNVYLDDFGSGYSSLSYLTLLDLNGVKLDRSLALDPTERRSEQVIRAINSIADGLDLKVVAEGIEDPKQFRALQDLDCDAAQGFGIGVPQSLSEVEVWLQGYGKTNVNFAALPQSFEETYSESSNQPAPAGLGKL